MTDIVHAEAQALIEHARHTRAKKEVLRAINEMKDRFHQAQDFVTTPALRNVERELVQRLAIKESFRRHGLAVFIETHRVQEIEDLFLRFAVVARKVNLQVTVTKTLMPTSCQMESFLDAIRIFAPEGAVDATIPHVTSVMNVIELDLKP